MKPEDEKYIKKINKIHMEIGTALMKIAGYTSSPDIQHFRPLLERFNMLLNNSSVKSVDELYNIIYELVEDK
jgi:hypothetical protein